MFHQTAVFILLTALRVCLTRPTDGLQSFELLKYSPVQLSMSLDEEDSSGLETYESSTLHRNECLEDEIASIDFEAYSRNFSLRLQKVCQDIEQAEELLASGDFITIDDVTKSVVYFQGYLEGESNSTVDGTMESGVFQGVIITDDHQKYIIERLNKTIYGSHSFIYHVHSKEQVIATLFAEGNTSGQLPTDLLTENNKIETEGSGSN